VITVELGNDVIMAVAPVIIEVGKVAFFALRAARPAMPGAVLAYVNGLHVVVPLAPKLDYDTVKDFSQAVVQHLAKTIPSRFVAKSGAPNRVRKIFVDCIRNGHGATTGTGRA
jgi:hypothetical protein